MAGADVAVRRAEGGHELATRVVVGAGLIAVAITCWHSGGIAFEGLVFVACLLACRELLVLRVLPKGWNEFASFLYILVPAVSIVWLRVVHEYGLFWTMLIFGIVWTADIMAFVGGRLIGGPKLWPKVSPNKTVAGFCSALIGGAIIGWIFRIALASSSGLNPFDGSAEVLGACLGALAQGGDLFESALKRRAGVKDSGTLLPGHGGVLDRIDSLIPVAPAVAGAVALGWL